MALLEKNLVVKTSLIPQAGQGLFTTTLIPKGTRVVEYKGRVTDWKNVRSDNGDNGYIYFMKRTHVIDASRALSSLARFSNDARGLTRIKGLDNNAEYVEDGLRVYIVSKREIRAGEEIFVSYGPEYWKTIRHNMKVEKDRLKEEADKAAKKEKAAAVKAAKLEKIAAKKRMLKDRKLARAQKLAARKQALKDRRVALKLARKTAKKK